jgi:putative transcriptional regulator
MKISYKKLWIMLVENDLKKREFGKRVGISPGTITRLNKGMPVSVSVLLQICEYFHCNIGDICDAIPDDK